MAYVIESPALMKEAENKTEGKNEQKPADSVGGSRLHGNVLSALRPCSLPGFTPSSASESGVASGLSFDFSASVCSS